MSVHLKATGLDNEDLSRLQEEIDKMPKLVDAIQEHLPGEDDIMVLGDFNLSPNTEGRVLCAQFLLIHIYTYLISYSE